MTKPKPRRRGTVRIHKGTLELRAYAGVNPATKAHVMPGKKPPNAVTRTTAIKTRFGFTPPTTMTGAIAAWTMPITTARSGPM